MTDTGAWERIDRFESDTHYEKFQRWLFDQMDSNHAHEIPVGTRYSRELSERWFVCKESREIWRLVAPYARFKGLWNLVQPG
jgi:hypothetical protein